MLFMRVIVLRLLLLCKLLRSCWSREYQWRRTLLDSAWFYCLYYWLILCILIFSDPMVHVLQEMVVRIWILNNKFMWKKVFKSIQLKRSRLIRLLSFEWKTHHLIWCELLGNIYGHYNSLRYLLHENGCEWNLARKLMTKHRLIRYDVSGFISSHFRCSYL